ncbi:MAG TPA: hypothetical protein VFO10_00270 [Oligoflexus sp.]|uniref:hypothetical protein n=1 Tax=Oligoflexus sp. TaxID=1971216 RepID=UPI002D80BD10|nr:hypothetical protein [Oligoflexus sp.]HET9235649.1 hypothetical protein [Oligoflexus sp.]
MNSSKLTLCLVFCLALGACNKSGFRGKSSTDGGSGDVNGAVDAAASGPNAVTDTITISKNVDLVIALDSSGSMDEERAAVSVNLNKLILALQKGSLDPRIHLIAGREEDDDEAPVTGPVFSFPPDVDAGKVALIVQEIGSHDALGHVSQTLSGAYAARYQNVKGMVMNPPLAFRPEAKLEVLVISDDNGINGQGAANTMGGNTAKDFDPMNKWKATVSGVIGTPTSMQAAGLCQIAAVGQEYITLAAQTGGSILDICSPDWSMIIDRFTKDVLKRSQSILLSREPLNPDKLLVTLGGKVLSQDAWVYDAATRLVTLSAKVAVTAGLELKVNYEAKP